MKKSELKQMIREEVKREIYAVLPKLLEEAMSNVLKNKKLLKTTRPARAKPRPVEEASLEFDSTRMKELIGYGDFDPGKRVTYTDLPVEDEILSEGPEHLIAGVQVPGGLAEHEEAATAGMGFNEMPPELLKAIGNAKGTFDKAESNANFRPGKK